MKCIFLILGILFSMGLRTQAQDLKTLQEKKAAFETKGTDNTVDYIQVLIDLSQVHLAQEQLEESREVLMLAGGVIKKLKQFPSYSDDSNSSQQVLAVHLCHSNYILAWFKQLVIEDSAKVAQDYLEQEDWFNQTMLLEEQRNFMQLLEITTQHYSTTPKLHLKEQRNFIQLLEITNQYYGSLSKLYLKNWCKIYALYTSSGTRNTQKAEEMWLNLLKIRKEKFGKTSNGYISILFGCSNFYSRINRTADFQKLKTQVQESWPLAYSLEPVTSKMSFNEYIEETDYRKKEREKKGGEVFTIVEAMPRFPGCEDIEGHNSSKKKCADQNLSQFIRKNMNYPDLVHEGAIEGMAIISFTVSPHGTINDTKILRDPGGGIGKDALRLVLKMNELPERWTPGTQREKAVRVRVNLPIRYKLD